MRTFCAALLASGALGGEDVVLVHRARLGDQENLLPHE